MTLGGNNLKNAEPRMKNLLFLTFQLLLTGLLSAQELELEDGIYFEKPLYRDSTDHKYSLDNISYKVNSVFVFDYYYIDKDGTKKKFLKFDKSVSNDNPLNLVSYDSKENNAIAKIKIVVEDYLKVFAGDDSDYTQTVFSYMYLKPNENSTDTFCEKYNKKHPKDVFPCGDESTGIVDNRRNLWIHPPRLFTFRILQLNPFPFYYLDVTVKTWSWHLGTAGFYLDPRWINQSEKITIEYNYSRQADEMIETPLGKLRCKVTQATGSCPLQNGSLKTGLKSFYHPDYGFVRLEYENVNGTKLVMQLIDMK